MNTEPRRTIRTPWPTFEQYALAHRCPQCKAEAGEPCTWRRSKEGWPFHARRSNLAAHHHRCDIGKAPWPEQRISGQRYDSLPFAIEFRNDVTTVPESWCRP